MDANGRLVNIIMIVIVFLFLALGFGSLAIYSAFARDRQVAAPPGATLTPTRLAALPSLTAPSAVQCKNDAALITAATEPNESEFPPRLEFVQVWRVKNTGSCTWNGSYKFVFVDGARMGAASEMAVPDTAPGATSELKVKLTAPANSGVSAGVWQMKAPGGERFGPTLNTTIRVSKPGSRACNGTPVITTFLANPTTIAAGKTTTLSWGLVENADAAEIDQGIGGVATPGGRSVSPKTTTTYTLTARCGPILTQAQVTVIVR